MIKKLKRVETWHLDDDAIGPLLRAMHLGQRRVYQSGDYLYRQGELSLNVFLIIRGHVLISSTSEDGSEFTLEIMGRQAICGEAAAFDGSPSFTSAVALEDTETIIFPAKKITSAFTQFPEIAVALLRITALKQRIIAVRAHYLASLKPEARIAELLHRLANQYGIRVDGGTIIGIALTHKQIASLTGTTRVTVTRVLKRLREVGEIDISDRHIVIPDPSSPMKKSSKD